MIPRGVLELEILEALVEVPLTTNELAARFGVMRSTVWNVCNRLEREGRLYRFKIPEASSSVLWALRRPS